MAPETSQRTEHDTCFERLCQSRFPQKGWHGPRGYAWLACTPEFTLLACFTGQSTTVRDTVSANHTGHRKSFPIESSKATFAVLMGKDRFDTDTREQRERGGDSGFLFQWQFPYVDNLAGSGSYRT